ncbi:MAG: hypothetical protein KAT90_13005 [Gammaproteobacteria bacterium]|nr:hypothetical protein [Gammaproteobacteria bacterium]
MNKQKLQLVFVMMFSLLTAQQVVADSLYQQQVEQAVPDDKQLQEVLKIIKEYKEIKLQGELFTPIFHQRSELAETSKQPVCVSCHQALPHRKNKRSRTFMNGHSQYVACETCHMRPENIKLEYRWLAYDGDKAGQEIIVSDNQKNNVDKESRQQSLIPKSGARIAPFYNDKPVLEFKGDDFINEIKSDWKEASAKERAAIHARLHAPLEDKAAECQQCHGKEKSMLNLKALGASEKQIGKIQRSAIVRYFARFKKDDQRIRLKDLLK